MKKIINSVLLTSAVTFLAATPIKADLSIALVVNETAENVTLECGLYTLKVPAGQRIQPLRLAVPCAGDYSCPFATIGTNYKRVSFWSEGNNLITAEELYTAIALKNMDIAHSAGLVIRVTPQGVVFRLLADFEKTVLGTICA